MAPNRLRWSWFHFLFIETFCTEGPGPTFWTEGPAPTFWTKDPAPSFWTEGPAPTFWTEGPAPIFWTEGTAPTIFCRPIDWTFIGLKMWRYVLDDSMKFIVEFGASHPLSPRLDHVVPVLFVFGHKILPF